MAATQVDRDVEMQRLLFRLEDGFEKIVKAAAAGEDTARWEDVWIDLLTKYEALYAAAQKEKP